MSIGRLLICKCTLMSRVKFKACHQSAPALLSVLCVYLFKPSVWPQQAAVLREGGLERLVAAAAAMEPGLRCNGVWALQNLVHAASLAVKAALLGALPWPAASTLLSDPEPDIQARVRMQLAPCCCRPSGDARYRRTSLIVGSEVSIVCTGGAGAMCTTHCTRCLNDENNKMKQNCIRIG